MYIYISRGRTLAWGGEERDRTDVTYTSNKRCLCADERPVKHFYLLSF